MVHRVGDGFVLAIDRSPRAIAQALAGSTAELATGRLAFRCVAIEAFAPDPGDAPFDLAFAVRVGALDGRHPRAGLLARQRIAAALAPDGLLWVDDGPAVPRAALLAAGA